MPVQVVTAIMSLAMMRLALVVVLVVLDYAEGSEFTPLFFPVYINPIHLTDAAYVELMGLFASRFNLPSWVEIIFRMISFHPSGTSHQYAYIWQQRPNYGQFKEKSSGEGWLVNRLGGMLSSVW